MSRLFCCKRGKGKVTVASNFWFMRKVKLFICGLFLEVKFESKMLVHEFVLRDVCMTTNLNLEFLVNDILVVDSYI